MRSVFVDTSAFVAVQDRSDEKHDQAIKFCDTIQMIYVDESVHALAWQIAVKCRDKSFSFTDCASFAIMSQLNVSHAFCFDVNFQQYGALEIVPAPDRIPHGESLT